MLSTYDKAQKEPERIINVNNVLDELIEQSVALVGKPVALMNKDDKIRAIRFLNESGAFLVTKSGDKVAKYFGISKYTLYNYLEEARISRKSETNE
jgi:predicted transcriptional regulator YheO